MEKECAICGGLFFTENKNRKYCDDCAAHTQTRRNEVERAERRIRRLTYEPRLFEGKCEQCGIEFKTPRRLLFSQKDPETNKGIVFCGRKCRREWLHSHDVCDFCGKALEGNCYTIPGFSGLKFCANRNCAERYLASNKIRIETVRECEFCGKKYVSDNERFCSQSCYLKAKRQGTYQRIRLGKKKGLRFFRRNEFCACCGKEMVQIYRLPVSYDDLYTRHTCSPECQAIEEERKMKSASDSRTPDSQTHDIETPDSGMEVKLSEVRAT